MNRVKIDDNVAIHESVNQRRKFGVWMAWDLGDARNREQARQSRARLIARYAGRGKYVYGEWHEFKETES